uniref:Small ribosomal subunit protein uS9c n=1 Tax=Johansenicoccus eremophilus TaxID=3068301 RepID=A0AA49LM85_9CHLO|nr:ribosomal protein S9 [Chlorophyceae sp. KF-2023a]
MSIKNIQNIRQTDGFEDREKDLAITGNLKKQTNVLAVAVGRRKEAVAQVRFVLGTGQFIINGKPVQTYLQNNFYSLLTVKAPFEILQNLSNTTGGNSITNPSEGGDNKNNKMEDSVSAAQTVSTVGQTSKAPLVTGRGKQNILCQPDAFDTIVKVEGGGLGGQAEAIKLGIARAICKATENEIDEIFPNLQAALRSKGCLTQDARAKERRKYGLKKARKAPQYHKR